MRGRRALGGAQEFFARFLFLFALKKKEGIGFGSAVSCPFSLAPFLLCFCCAAEGVFSLCFTGARRDCVASRAETPQALVARRQTARRLCLGKWGFPSCFFFVLKKTRDARARNEHTACDPLPPFFARPWTTKDRLERKEDGEKNNSLCWPFLLAVQSPKNTSVSNREDPKKEPTERRSKKRGTSSKAATGGEKQKDRKKRGGEASLGRGWTKTQMARL